MKNKLFLILIFLLLASSSGLAQIKVNDFSIQEKNIIMKSYSSNYSSQGGYSHDTVRESYSFSTSRFLFSNSSYTDRSISFNDFFNSNMGHSWKNIVFEFDTSKKVIKNITYTDGERFSSNQIDPADYWDSSSRTFAIKNLPYSESLLGDTLFANLDSKELRTFYDQNLFSLEQGGIRETPHTGSSDDFYIREITDSAFLKVVIIGKFPLSVRTSYRIQNEFHPFLKILKLCVNQTPSCYDLLGRKHSLEFLGTDGAWSTYSLRSLQAGVYFVSDGREMVKFLVGE